MLRVFADCRLCNSTGLERFYDTRSSECKTCGSLMGSMTGTWLALGAAFSALCIEVICGKRVRRVAKRRYARQLTKWAPLKLQARIVWSTYQVLSQVPTIYQLSVPSSVASIIASLTPIFDVGIGGLTTMPLQCLGFGGFLAELIVTMLIPIVALVVTSLPIQSILRPKRSINTSQTRRASRMKRAGKQAKRKLPLALFISFIVFPIVSTQVQASSSRLTDAQLDPSHRRNARFTLNLHTRTRRPSALSSATKWVTSSTSRPITTWSAALKLIT